MANTYVLIASNTLGASAASVTFSSIPSTYTDLVVRISGRTDGAVTQAAMQIYLNNDSAANHSGTFLQGDGATATSGRPSQPIFIGRVTGTTGTSNTFNNLEVYIPSYTASQNKPFSGFSAQENNTTTAYLSVEAALYSSTSTVNRIDFICGSGGYNFASGSSFYLYGIKNS